MAICNQVIDFYENYTKTDIFLSSYHLHNPFDAPSRRAAIEEFCHKFYSDEAPRTHLLGINPSRLTASSTGVNYTDGFALDNHCGIENKFSKSRELTASFFYEVVQAVGGALEFYSKVFAWAALPVAITENNSYKNYYEVDDNRVKNLVVQNIEWLTGVPRVGRLVIIGSGDNRKYLEGLPGFPYGYNEVFVLPHPRWIMQYNKRNIEKYIADYAGALGCELV